ncbi:MAG: hypothetical protein OXI77_18305 [Chloroflexota bacterium]|nr:hypothetical protein [Chloroflexota bacterium]MDE2909017.1 hypothetical protein [Chloroflexota bacterium]
MVTTDIRLKRIEKEYQSVRGVQDDILDKMDSYEAAMLGLTEMVAENRRMLEAIIKHLDVPYEPMGFIKE